MKKIEYAAIGIALILLLGFILLGVRDVTHNKNKINIQKVQLQSTEAKILDLQLRYNALSSKLKVESESKEHNQAKIDQLEAEKKALEEQQRKLEADLQAKANNIRLEQEKVAQAAQKALGAQKAYAASSSCNDWIVAAGIDDVESAVQLIQHESGCNPYAVNASSGACGVAQELVCGKSGCQLGDGACQVKWMNQYVLNRYGSWSNAWYTWNSRSPHWY